MVEFPGVGADLVKPATWPLLSTVSSGSLMNISPSVTRKVEKV
jgi:hypothetical protein